MADNKYKLNVYNTTTKKYEEVEISEELYNVYRRTGWNIENNDKRYFDHENQMSSLIGGDKGAYENFREFIDTDNTPENVVLEAMQNEDLIKALSFLDKDELVLINAVYFNRMTMRECSEKYKIPLMTAQDRKTRILKKLKKILE